MLGKQLKKPYNNVKVQKDDWDQHFPLLTMAYSSSLQESPKCTLSILINTTKEDFISYRPYHRAYRNISPVKCPQKYVERLKVAMQNAFDFA